MGTTQELNGPFLFVNCFQSVKEACVFGLLLSKNLSEAHVNRVGEESCNQISKDHVKVACVQLRFHIIIVLFVEHVLDVFEGLLMALVSTLAHDVCYLGYRVF